MTEKEKWELIHEANKGWNEFPIEKRKQLSKYSTAMQLQTLVQAKSKYSNDMSPNLKRKITEWEDNIAKCLKTDIDALKG
jgi:hypothetical protein